MLKFPYSSGDAGQIVEHLKDNCKDYLNTPAQEKKLKIFCEIA